MLDDLLGTALVLERGERQLALIGCDLVFVYDDLLAMVRHQVEEQTGIPGTHVLIAASHTHSGPAYGGHWEGGNTGRKYKANLACLLAGAVTEAHGKMQPARVAAGQGRVNANVNRRKRLRDGSIVLGENPEGTVDQDTAVVRVDDLGGNLLGVLVNYAAHPVCLRPSNLMLSADWVGFMRRALEGVIGAPVLFLQGAAGNVIPAERGTEASAKRVGYRVAGEALKVLSTIRTIPKPRLVGDPRDHSHLQETVEVVVESNADVPLGVCQKLVGMPMHPPVSRHELEEFLAARIEHLKRMTGTMPELDELAATVLQREWFERELATLEAEGTAVTFPVEVQAIRIGNAALVAFPAEVFTEIGLVIKARSPFPVTMFVSCANGGRLPYVPTEEAFGLGGYEVERARGGGEMPSGLAQTAAEALVDRAVALLDDLWNGV